MAPVVAELKALPDEDIRAMATYLAGFGDPLSAGEAQTRASRIAAASSATAHPATSVAARLYEGACAACHDAGHGALTVNLGPPLGLNTNLHASRPTNFLRVVLDGIDGSGQGAMPGFAGVLSDGQIADLARYARSRFAPDKPAWDGVEETIARLRQRPQG